MSGVSHATTNTYTTSMATLATHTLSTLERYKFHVDDSLPQLAHRAFTPRPHVQQAPAVRVTHEVTKQQNSGSKTFYYQPRSSLPGKPSSSTALTRGMSNAMKVCQRPSCIAYCLQHDDLHVYG
jgi:hypothetical protein